ncbi:extracellular matrix protein 1 isoform X2 [Gracilinanus agilis]|uniref:extracellular matrix protein 1 isoform X2 n=1 Tax=Gracilinanus agilis TaxID=191870 RepID=UPI001CFD7C54|nr:extracellular matrix protein 1 isoform X2 [Gracilinanus agilis]
MRCYKRRNLTRNHNSTNCKHTSRPPQPQSPGPMPAACPRMGAAAPAALLLMLLASGASASQGGPSEQREAIPEHFPKEVGYAAPPAPSSPQEPDLEDLIVSHRAFEGQTETVHDFFEDFPPQQAQSPQKLPLDKKEPSPEEAAPIQKEIEPPRHLPLDQREAQSSLPPAKTEQIPHQEQREVIRSQFGEQLPSHREEHKPPRCQPESRTTSWGYRLDGFPPGRPSSKNIDQICHPDRKHVVYGPWNLPQTGYSHLSRQGSALNFLETGYTRCCRLPKDREDCAEFVWADALFRFCESEFSVKTRAHSCCWLQGEARLSCFQEGAPRPDYERLHEPCPPPTPRPAPGLELSFPPGVPSPANVRNICRLRRFRTVPRGLPATEHVQRQLRVLTQLEGKFRRCCHQGENHTCARQAWEEALDSYCDEELAIKTHHHVCCQHPVGPARDICFARHAPYPNYDRDILTVDLSRITPHTMGQLCGHRKVLTKHKQIPGLIRNMTARCCELAPPEQEFCAEEEKSIFIRDLCGSRRDLWRDTEYCCDQSPGDEQTCCFNIHYLRNVALVAGVSQKPRGTTELPLVTPTPEHKE